MLKVSFNETNNYEDYGDNSFNDSDNDGRAGIFTNLQVVPFQNKNNNNNGKCLKYSKETTVGKYSWGIPCELTSSLIDRSCNAYNNVQYLLRRE